MDGTRSFDSQLATRIHSYNTQNCTPRIDRCEACKPSDRQGRQQHAQETRQETPTPPRHHVCHRPQTAREAVLVPGIVVNIVIIFAFLIYLHCVKNIILTPYSMMQHYLASPHSLPPNHVMSCHVIQLRGEGKSSSWSALGSLWTGSSYIASP